MSAKKTAAKKAVAKKAVAKKTVARKATAGKGAAVNISKFRLDSATGHLLHRCQQMAEDIYMREVGRKALRPRQLALLQALYRMPGASQADLVRETGIDRSTLAEMIVRLTQRKLIQRKPSPEDKRANRLQLSKTGERELSKSLAAIADVEKEILAPLSRDRRKAFVEDLRTLAGVK